jgi:hypothetical protein
MQMWKASKPYTLKAAYAECYFHNKANTTGNSVEYDGIVVPMNPERMKDYDTDIVFIHGQQSHPFNSWRVLRDPSATMSMTSPRTYMISELWPPKLLSDEHKSRMLSVNYEVGIHSH